MGKLKDEAVNLVQGAGDVLQGFSGQTGSEAAERSGELQYQSSKEAREQLERLNQPYLQLGEKAAGGVSQFLNDPSGFTALAFNPMFHAALDNTQKQLKGGYSAVGKLNSGGLVNELFQNYLATGDQFVNSAYNRLLGPLNIGQSSANFTGGGAADLITGGASALGAGGIGSANAQSQGMSNLVGGLAALEGSTGALSSLGSAAWSGLSSLGSSIAGFFSDERLKEDMRPIGVDENGLTLYEFKYKSPMYIGYSAQEVAEKDPANSSVHDSGFLMVSEKYKPKRVS